MTITDAQVHSLMAGCAIVIPPEKQAALHRLMEERKERTSALKISHFKAMPASMRQYIIDCILWTRTMTSINNAEAPKTPEEAGLEMVINQYETLSEITTGHNPNTYHNMIQSMMRSNRMYGANNNVFKFNTDKTPYTAMELDEKVITLKQLMDAHAEQCIADGIT